MHDASLPRLVVFGEALTDFVRTGEATWHSVAGGACWNVARVAATLGVPTGWGGAVGDDVLGREIIAKSQAAGLDLYTADATERTYERLFALARTALQAGFPVVLDAAFLRHDERERAHAVARACGAAFGIVACKAPLPVLRERIRKRRGDASEADLAVLEKLRASEEPLREQERPFLVVPPGQPQEAAAC